MDQKPSALDWGGTVIIFWLICKKQIIGEVSFDLLDDNLLFDIMTSNRQGCNELDGRWKLLTQIMRPLVRELINKRNTRLSKEKKKKQQ